MTLLNDSSPSPYLVCPKSPYSAGVGREGERACIGSQAVYIGSLDIYRGSQACLTN